MAVLLGLLTVPPATAQDLREGLAAYGRGDYAAALREIGPLAAAGNPRAQNNIGLMFLRGQGVPKDEAQAVAWFRPAAARGYATAQYNLAVMHLRGLGVPRDFVEAATWFRLAADQGHARAQYNLAVMHLKGDGVLRDNAEAAAWLGKAAARGHPGAAEILRSMRGEGGEGGERAAAASLPAMRGDDDGTGAAPAAKPPPQPAPAGQEAPAAPPGPAPEPSPAIAPPAPGAFRVQLGAVRSESVAAREAERLNRILGPALGALRVEPVRADLGERGVYFRLRAGPLDGRAAAGALCRDLGERGQPCIVVKP